MVAAVLSFLNKGLPGLAAQSRPVHLGAEVTFPLRFTHLLVAAICLHASRCGAVLLGFSWTLTNQNIFSLQQGASSTQSTVGQSSSYLVVIVTQPCEGGFCQVS